jgi:Fungal specific transcription factor domain
LKKTECFAQEYAPIGDRQEATKSRKDLRLRVERLENALESLIKTKGEQVARHDGTAEAQQVARTDAGPRSPPDKAELPQSAHNEPFHTLSLISMIEVPLQDIQIRNALISLLPKGEALASAMDSSYSFWMELRYQFPSRVAQCSTLQEFASCAISGGSLYEVAEVAQILSSSNSMLSSNQALQLIDRLIICNAQYASSVQGLHCAVTQTILLGDRGDLDLAWQTCRRSITQSQIQGLHKTRTSKETARLWWSLYSLDRYMSLKLGRPYGLSESHCSLEQTIRAGNPIGSTWTYGDIMIQLSRVAGKVIDFIHGMNHMNDWSIYSFVQLEQELDFFASKIPLQEPRSDNPLSQNQDGINWRQKILPALLTYQCYLSLQLPFLSQSSQDPAYAHIKDQCIQNARNFLCNYKLYFMSTGICHSRSFDDTALVAVAILFIRLSGFERALNTNEQWQDTVDSELINVSMDILGSHGLNLNAATAAFYDLLRHVVEIWNNCLSLARVTLQFPTLMYGQFSGTKSVDEFLQVAKTVFRTAVELTSEEKAVTDSNFTFSPLTTTSSQH